MAIHPTQFASERISGRLKLIKQGNALSMVLTFHVFSSENLNILVSVIRFGYRIAHHHCRIIWFVVMN